MDIDTYLDKLDRLEAEAREDERLRVAPSEVRREDEAEFFYQEWVEVLMEQEA